MSRTALGLFSRIFSMILNAVIFGLNGNQGEGMLKSIGNVFYFLSE